MKTSFRMLAIASLAIVLVNFVGCASEQFREIDKPIVVNGDTYTALVTERVNPLGTNAISLTLIKTDQRPQYAYTPPVVQRPGVSHDYGKDMKPQSPPCPPTPSAREACVIRMPATPATQQSCPPPTTCPQPQICTPPATAPKPVEPCTPPKPTIVAKEPTKKPATAEVKESGASTSFTFSSSRTDINTIDVTWTNSKHPTRP